MPDFSPALAERLVHLALRNIKREYPTAILHVATSKPDSRRSQRDLHPSFYGCFDWHSSVETHWSIVRLLRSMPGAPWSSDVTRALSQSFAPSRLAAEAEYTRDHPGFERPYGLAWLLQLAAELRQAAGQNSDIPHFPVWSAALRPLERAAVRNVTAWFAKLQHPMRTGTHNQTAFSMGLMLDYARARRDRRFEALLLRKARSFYFADRDAVTAYDLGGEDFLSPILGEADLMRRVLTPRAFARWLSRFLPAPKDVLKRWLTPARSPDRADGRLAHLDGLNLSRAWMLAGIASGLTASDVRIRTLRAAAATHRMAGLMALTSDRYELTHWLGAYAIYLETSRGLD